MLEDYHVHTEFSDDSVYPMEQTVKDAIARGLDEICFTDHVDYGVKTDVDVPGEPLYRKGGPGEPEAIPLTNVNYPEYYRQYQTLKARYAGKIRLKLGLEFGMQRHTIPQYEELFSRYPFDFILLSIHEIDDLEFWTQDFQRGKTQREYNMRYYEEMLFLVQHFHNYSVLAHLDLITRYDKAGIYPFEELRPILTEILKTVIADGKGIEVNTSCYRYGLNDLTPSRDILKLYKDLGGSIITIGSDSHRPEHLGAYIHETIRKLRLLGFTEFCTFEKMDPIFHRIQFF